MSSLNSVESLLNAYLGLMRGVMDMCNKCKCQEVKQALLARVERLENLQIEESNSLVGNCAFRKGRFISQEHTR
ncbi:hypothetical protein LHK12_22275 [Providencia rettgeri]|nr:hypothetical protein [Providencia rettgeri]